MSINPWNISLSLPLLLLLLLFIAAGGSVRSGFGQDTARNITISDIIDLEANMTGRDQGAGEHDDDNDSNFPQLNDIGNDNDNSSGGSSGSTISTSSSSLS